MTFIRGAERTRFDRMQAELLFSPKLRGVGAGGMAASPEMAVATVAARRQHVRNVLLGGALRPGTVGGT